LSVGFANEGSHASLEDLSVLRNEQTHRTSSSDANDWQNGNADARPIDPGDTLTLAEMDGPGEIRHLWFTISAEDPDYPQSLVFRVYYDDRKVPGVECPLGDFFAVGHGLKRAYQSAVYEISSDGRAYNSFWRMPFYRRIRLTVTNESDKRVNAFYSYVDWASFPALPKDTAYFHARYRQEFPCVSGTNYLILETEGEGVYVGTVLSAQFAEQGWFGEGDDFIYIDGEEEPSYKGTGTEDYFSDAWGFREFTQMNHGVPIWEGFDAGDRVTAYRWHIQDPIRFEKSIRVEIEHKGSRHDENGKVLTGYEERADDFASVAFWYQKDEPTGYTPFPPLAERTKKKIRIEAETCADGIQHSTGAVIEQNGGQWSGEKQLLFQAHLPNSELSLPFHVEGDLERVSVQAILTSSWDYGIYEIRLDDIEKPITVDLYSPEVKVQPVSLGVHSLAKGDHTLKFRNVGCNPQSKLKGSESPGYFLGIDLIELGEIPKKRK
ncbi:MAG: DUF2961 domain-containing protein, partial [Candidatus Omnitrophica bacterium]|nr:DUF2961 domain-containing protein [Candidatus Omnitrophota bacterium]